MPFSLHDSETFVGALLLQSSRLSGSVHVSQPHMMW